MPTTCTRSVKFCCAGSASVAAEFDHFITATIKHIFLKKILTLS
ncbi:hypothetical protein A671_02636 [Salmonella enterica subsp. enterica serovar Dublin str. DG22]|uniref:Uncharacterized protein n=1 Tax=Salmonella enterica subsp. enterica serovar Dublin str. UC16 TaxID=1192688 RepID=M7RFZ3_SALDU|nr:hypothetical protein SG9_0343 [Salmonella enterica subsp. enterica serovar Gallinarum str. SG9]EMR50693.1 hypothetical protein A670_04129 [Salmonella enterica subsp. enterica serovar Dublin str. UC16]EPI69252.1 hypothetical protein A671_02636 [Salmonella enterica subsp. enterica serovar Dublin str. DG22]VGM89985.1 hypothetical protein UPM517_2300 [Salmonella enterica subsp. enterica serovar Stanley]